MIWGFAGPWYGEYNCSGDDAVMKRLNFLVAHGFKSTAIGFDAMREPKQREAIAALVEQHDLQLTVYLHQNWVQNDQEAIKRSLEDFAANMEKYGAMLRVPIVTTSPGGVHRFMRQPPFNEQLDRMSQALAPAAQVCHELGTPLGIENHGDYYCSDLVEICKRTPHLYIFLDTGNTYLIGEQSVAGCRAATPYTIGTHFKDHYVRPDHRQLCFQLDGAPLGEGDVGLAEVYRILLAQAPEPHKLIMQWEMVTPKGMSPLECLERSWTFIRALEKENP